MKLKKKDRRAYAAKASALKRLLGSGMLLEGSLTKSMRGGSEHCQLTDKVDGKTRTLYVPARHAGEVTESMALWKRVRRELKELSAVAREAYANAFAELSGGGGRAKQKGRCANGPKAPKSRARSRRASKSGTASLIRKAAPASVPPKSRTLRKRRPNSRRG